MGSGRTSQLRKVACTDHALISLLPIWELLLSLYPVNHNSFITPLLQERHGSPMSTRVAELLHGYVILPKRKRPGSSMGILHEFSAKKSWRVNRLPDSLKRIPSKPRKKPWRPDVQTSC